MSIWTRLCGTEDGKETPLKNYISAFNKTVFRKKEVTDLYGYSGIKKSTYWEKIDWSGRTVQLEKEILYECLEDNKVVWIDKRDLKFPK